MATCPKTCSKCSREYGQPVGKHGSMCRPCKSARDRVRRASRKETRPTWHEKTAKGFLSTVAVPSQERDAFYKWALIDPDFIALFRDWTVAGWPKGLRPVAHRLDDATYVWVTFDLKHAHYNKAS